MMLLATALQVPPPPPPDTSPTRDTVLVASAADMATAYADEETRELVRRARGHRGTLAESIFRYRAVVRQRVSVGIRALMRDRLIFRREMAAEVDWRRDAPPRVHVLGAREAVPVAMPGIRVADNIMGEARGLVMDPAEDLLMVMPNDDGFAWHPLIEGGEAVYTYATGDTTIIRLPDGRELRIVELRVTPRRRDIRLVTGSFWVELDDYALVQAVFRPSRDFDLERDLPELEEDGQAEVDEVPDILKPIGFDVRYITMEFGFWELEWWMPRMVAFSGYARVGAVRIPVEFEISYSDYRIETDRYGLPSLPVPIRELVGPAFKKPRPRPYSEVTIVTMADSAELLESELLPESFFSAGEALITEGEIRELGRRLGALPPAPWQTAPPRVSLPWETPSLVRYNRIEGLSAGARVDWDLGRARLDATARIATEAPVPVAELGAATTGPFRRWRAAAYRRLAPSDPALRPLGPGNSINALLFGRDDGMYHRTLGLEALLTPAEGSAYRVRVYGERQDDAERSAHFSLPRLFGSDRTFRPNIDAATATQAGMDLAVGGIRGLDPNGFRFGAWLDVKAETGDYDFVRPALTLRVGFPLPLRLIGGIEAAAGTTLGDSPIQSRWFVGGSPTLRGFPGGWAAAAEYGRARAEVATDFPAARIALFSDAAWAGPLADFDRDLALVSAGAGASFLDGLIRLDVARAIQPVTRWRVDLYLDAMF